MKTTLKLLFASLLFVACHSSNNDDFNTVGLKSFATSPVVEEAQTMDFDANQNRKKPSDNIERKLIKTGDISFETENLEATRQNIINLVKKYKGYVSSDRKNEYDYRINYTLSVRVPAQYFDTLVSGVEKNALTIENKQVRISDVTEEFLDVESRLKNKKQLESRYLEILKKANTVKEILEVEKELGKLREDIEATEGRLNYLKNQVGFSTLHISFYKTVKESSSFASKIGEGFKNGFNYFKSFLIGLVSLWPFVILLILLFYLIKYRLKKK